MNTTVVYIHGNGNKIRKDRLKEEWDRALFGQDMGRLSQMAYWADLRYEKPLEEPDFDEVEMVPASTFASAESATVDPRGLMAEALAEAGAGKGGNGGVGFESLATGDALLGWLREMSYVADALAEGEQIAGAPRAELLALPRPIRVALFRTLVKVTFKDVYAYFFDGFQERMRASLRDTLAGIEGPVVVIGHSLGSIIAYDVLREPEQEALDIPLFVTVGSPLAVTEVQNLVVQDLRVPVGVTEWRNVADGRDLVALDRTIRPEYAPDDRCTDFLVVNDSPTHHGIREYLSAPEVRDAVRVLVG